MGHSINCNNTLRLKPLAACLAVALCMGAVSAELSAGGSAQAAPAANIVKRHAVQRTGAAFLHLQQERLQRGWANARLQIRSGVVRPAGTVAVTSCADDGSAGTLRDAVSNAVDGDIIDLSALTCSTITLAQGAVSVDVDNLSLVGPGAQALTIDAAQADNVINLYGAEESGYGTLAISGMTLTNGSSLYSGGAIWAGNGANVTLTDSVVTNSVSNAKYASGGGVFAAGNVTLTNSTVADNTTNSTKYDGLGGGVYAGGDLTISNSTISGNTVKADGSYYDTYSYTYHPGGGLGGGVAAAGVTRISNSTISGNSASLGGGAFVMSLESLQNSTVTLNVTSEDNNSEPGIVPVEGGGVAVSTYANPVDTIVNSSIVFGNSGSGSYYGADFGGTGVITGSNNLIGDSSADVPAGTLTVNPQLQPLADNGGPTQTHALPAGSPAIDTGSNPDDLKTDQRGDGFPRVSGAAADIGAFEAAGDDTIFANGFDPQI